MQIGIAGVGGIGSNVTENLVRSGIKNLKIVDFDRVEQSNLNRQLYFEDQIGDKKVEALKKNLSRIDGEINIKSIQKKITSDNINDIFSDCEIVVEGFDKKEYKSIFIENIAYSKKLSVSANGVAGLDISDIEIEQVGNCYIVGDFSSDSSNHPLLAPKVKMVAAMMSNILLDKGELV